MKFETFYILFHFMIDLQDMHIRGMRARTSVFIPFIPEKQINTL